MEISFLLSRSARDLFKETIPMSELVSMTRLSWFSFLSLMRLRTAELAIITSTAGMRPPEVLEMSLWEMTPEMVLASWARIRSCWEDGKASIILSMVWLALLVWSEAKTRCPVSAAATAADMVS